MKKLPLMLTVAVVLVAAALLLNRRNQTGRRPDAEVGQPLLPGLETLLAGGSVQTVTLAKGEQKATLALGDKGWTVKEQHDYPADFARLQRVLLDLAKVKIGQVMPGVALASNETTAVQWLDASGKALAGLRLGQNRKGPTREDQPWGGADGGRFVSRDGSAKVFLVRDGLSELGADPKSWLETQILSVPATDITAITITHPDGETVELNKKDGGDLTLVGVGEKEEFDTSKRYGVGGAISYLRFAEVADPAAGDDVTGLATATVYRAATAKGQVFEARIGVAPAGKTDRFARFSVTLPAAEPEKPAENEDEAAKTAREARAKERTDLEKSTAELNAKLAPWTFLVSSYSTDNMTLRRAALVKAKPEPVPAATNAAPAVASAPAPAPASKPAPAAVPAAPAEAKPAPAPAPAAPAAPAPTPAT